MRESGDGFDILDMAVEGSGGDTQTFVATNMAFWNEEVSYK